VSIWTVAALRRCASLAARGFDVLRTPVIGETAWSTATGNVLYATTSADRE